MTEHFDDHNLPAAAAELRVVLSSLNRRLRAATGDDGVTHAQGMVLSRLARNGPATTADLARAELVRPQSMAATLGALEELGMVSRSRHPSDGRRLVVGLTPTGERFVRSARAAKEDWLSAAMTARLGPAERRAVIAVIPALRRLAEQ